MAFGKILLTVDAVVFGYTSKDGLSVLLIKRKIPPFQHSWAIPGGFVLEDESLEDAVERELQEETGVEVNFLEQLFTFGTPKRDPRDRVVTVAYYGLVKPSDFKISASTDAEDVAWFKLDELPELAFDHSDILKHARKRLSSKITYEPVGFELLEDKFPFSEFEKLYSEIRGTQIDRRNFKKKVLKLGFLEMLAEKQSHSGAGRPGNLFRFNKEKYFELKEKGVNLEI